MALINNWHIQSINFVLESSQAPVQTDIYMKPPKVPKDVEIPDLPKFTDRFIFIYKLIKNLYGLKGARKTWYDYLKSGMLNWGWHQLSIDEFLFTKNRVILVIYVDDDILIYPIKQKPNDKIISLMKDYDLTD